MFVLRFDHKLFSPLLAEAFCSKDTDAIRALCYEIFGSIRINIHFDADLSFATGSTLLRIISRNEADFMFDRSLNGPSLAHVGGRWNQILTLMATLISNSTRAGYCYINLDDEDIIPGLAFCSNKNSSLLIPDSEYLGSEGHEWLVDHINRNHVDWEDRAPIGFWRGGTTGVQTDGLLSLPRIQLCLTSIQNRDLIDARITSLPQLNDDDKHSIKDLNIMGEFVSVLNFQNYKYHIDIDGNTNSWSGLITKLHSGSPVIKIRSPGNYRQWYYHLLKPWINYIPADSAAEVPHLINRLINDDELAKKIGDNGRRLARHLDFENEVIKAVYSINRVISKDPAEFNSSAPIRPTSSPLKMLTFDQNCGHEK